MITVAIIAILARLALPAYQNYVLRASLQPAFQTLSASRVKLEQYFMDNRQYNTAGSTGTVCGSGVGANLTIDNSNSGKFTITCTAPTSTTYTITATGQTGSAVAGFVYTIDNTNLMQSTISKSGWPASCPTSWAQRPGSC